MAETPRLRRQHDTNHTRWLTATALATAGFTVFAAGGVSAIDIVPMLTPTRTSTRRRRPCRGLPEGMVEHRPQPRGQPDRAEQLRRSGCRQRRRGRRRRALPALFAIGGDGGTAGASNGNGGLNSAGSANIIADRCCDGRQQCGRRYRPGQLEHVGNTATATGGAIEVGPLSIPTGAEVTPTPTSTRTPTPMSSSARRLPPQRRQRRGQRDRPKQYRRSGRRQRRRWRRRLAAAAIAAAGGDGGTAGTSNTNVGANSATSGNSITTGNATAATNRRRSTVEPDENTNTST